MALEVLRIGELADPSPVPAGGKPLLPHGLVRRAPSVVTLAWTVVESAEVDHR
jgi:hypothetical protein